MHVLGEKLVDLFLGRVEGPRTSQWWCPSVSFPSITYKLPT
jgi:hypothetical protein